MRKTKNINQIGYVIRGVAILSLWGGGLGAIDMDPVFIPFDLFSKTNMLRAVNDGGFGCESIVSADIKILIKYDNGSVEMNHVFYNVSAPVHTQHFLGWKYLKAQGIE
jgi:hypothetical protein